MGTTSDPVVKEGKVPTYHKVAHLTGVKQRGRWEVTGESTQVEDR